MKGTSSYFSFDELVKLFYGTADTGEEFDFPMKKELHEKALKAVQTCIDRGDFTKDEFEQHFEKNP